MPARDDAHRPEHPSLAPHDEAPTRRIPRLQLDPAEHLDTASESATAPLGRPVDAPGTTDADPSDAGDRPHDGAAPVVGLGRRLDPEQEALLARLTSRRSRRDDTPRRAAAPPSVEDSITETTSPDERDRDGVDVDALTDTAVFAPVVPRSRSRQRAAAASRPPTVAAAAGPGGRPRRAAGRYRRRSLLVRVMITAGCFTLALVLSAAALVGYTYRKYNGQIHRVAVLQTKDPSIREASKQLHAANFLILGSDTRAGADASYGNVAGARSDTSIIVHLSPDHRKATVISIPRDSWVTIPNCRTSDGSVDPQHEDMFNSAFSIGGPACTIATVQRLTGIAITHFVEIDFSGFKDIVNALGTITVCSPQSVSDPNSGLQLHPGDNQLDGTQALAYVRARESLGDGSDLGRIKRQQMFLGDVLRKALDGSLLTDLGKLTSFLDAATKAITVDKGTTFGDLRTLATSMQGLDPKRVRFYTAPIADPDYTPPGTDMSGRVLLDATQGRALYDSVINDHKPVTVTVVNGKTVAPSRPATSSTTPTPTAAAPSANFDAGQRTCSL